MFYQGRIILEKTTANVSARPAKIDAKTDGQRQTMARTKPSPNYPSKTHQVMDKAIHSDEEDGQIRSMTTLGINP